MSRIEQLEDLLFEDAATGISTLTELSAGGDADAMFVLGMAYYDGEGVTPDPLRCADLLEEAVKRGHVEATHNLGCFRYYGYHFPPDFKNHELSAQLLELSAGLGYTPSMTFLGSMYENGEGVVKDLGRARRLYESAAELGDENGREFLARVSA